MSQTANLSVERACAGKPGPTAHIRRWPDEVTRLSFWTMRDRTPRPARSENPVRRLFALSVLAEVGGAEATAVLKALGEDRDPLVAAHALVTIAVKSVEIATP